MIRLNLDFILEKKQRSQKWLAEKAGISKTTVNDIYNNNSRRIDIVTLEKICEALDCEPGDIMKMERV